MSPQFLYQAGDWRINPGEIGYLFLTDKYNQSANRLDTFTKSALTPPDVAAQLLALQNNVRNNLILAIDYLNEGYKDNPEYIFSAGRAGTPYFAAIQNRFAKDMVSLSMPVMMMCTLAATHLRLAAP